MRPGTDILQELQELNSILTRMERVNVFTVPEGYFETLSTIIILVNNKTEFGEDVPPGYFDQLAGTILNKIKAQQPVVSAGHELRQLSPMLYSIQDSNVFEVPAGYFNSVADTINAKLKPRAPVVRMGIRASFMKYAAAAVVISFLSLGIFKIAHKSTDSTPVAIAMVLNPSIQKGKAMNDQQFNDALNKLSADEIAGYLEKNGDESDIAELSANIDDKSLPKQDDYILDQSALEKYLSDDNANQTAN
jgi:hypothetical protein